MRETRKRRKGLARKVYKKVHQSPYEGREKASARAFVEQGWLYLIRSTARIEWDEDRERRPN